MALILIAAWLGLLQLLVKMGVLKGWSLWMKLSPAIIYGLFFLIIAIPMNYTAPVGPTVVLRDSVQVSPAVAGRVISIDVVSGEEVAAGAPLFSIDPAPFEAEVAQLEAALELTRLRLQQAEELVARKAGREFDVQTYRAELIQAKARLAAAR